MALPQQRARKRLENVLVAYHRIDAAEMRDEDADDPTDKIVDPDPRDAIRDEDNDVLRVLAAAAPSKILVSSRLTPRVLLNPSGQPIIGAKRITLPGLRPADAERLLRSCRIEGDSAAIQRQVHPRPSRQHRNTPKALNNIAQGKRNGEAVKRHPGLANHRNANPEGVAQRRAHCGTPSGFKGLF